MNVVPFLWGWSDAEGLGFLESYHHERTFLHFPRYPHPTLAKSVGDEGIVLELRILAAARMLFSKFEKSTPLLVFGMARVFLGVWHRHRVLDSCHPVSTDFLKLYSIWCSLNGREIHKPGKTQLMSLPQVSGNWHPCKLKISLRSPSTLRRKCKKLPNKGQTLWASHIMEGYYLHANIILSPLGKAYEIEARRGEWPSDNPQLWIWSPSSSKSKPCAWKSMERASHHLLKNMIV